MNEAIKKVKNIINKHDNVFAFLGIMIMLSVYCFYFIASSTDEMYNIGNLYKIYNGGKIYNDCNIVTTPMFFYIGLLLFKIFGANYLTFRFYNFMIFVITFFNLYLLLKEMRLNKRSSFIIIIITTTIINLTKENTIYCSAGYNFLAVALYILGIKLKIKCANKKANNLIQGIMMFLIFYAKQNIGIYYIGATVFIDIIKDRNKIKNTIIQILIFIILLLLSLLQMHLYGNLKEFINYAFLGLSEFGSKNGALVALPGTILLIIFTIYIKKLLNANKILNKEEYEIFNCILIYSSFLLFVMYPICDLHHFLISGILLIALLIYAYLKLIEKKATIKDTKLIDAIILIILIFYIILSLINNIQYYRYFEKDDGIYYGTILTEIKKEDISNVCEYIKEKRKYGIDVKILSYKAFKYTMPLKINNGDLDMPFNGNLGKDGEAGLLNKIKKMENSEILITKDENKRCYQESLNIREYIVNNFEKIGEIENFYIYKTPVYDNNNYTSN